MTCPASGQRISRSAGWWCSPASTSTGIPAARSRARESWQRGAFTDLGKYGLTRLTAWYYAAQAMWCFGMLTVLLIVAQITLVVITTGRR
jgi:hypothetical protein